MSRSTAPASFIDKLRASVSTASTDAAELERCARDWSWSSLYAQQEGRSPLPDVVVRAASDEEVAATLRLASPSTASRSCPAAAARA